MASFKEWYANPQNRAKLNERRRQAYAADPLLREKAQARQALYRSSRKPPAPVLDGYTREQVCAELGISLWTFNSWRNKGFFPEPSKVNGRVQITENQRNLIGLVAEFHRSHGVRLSPVGKAQLQQIVDVVHHNWS